MSNKSDALNKEKLTGYKAALFTERLFSYIVLSVFALISLFFFYILLMFATRSHTEIIQGLKYAFTPGSLANLKKNFVGATTNGNYPPILPAMVNSLIIALSSATLTVYFSSLTAYALHAYNFKLKNAATVFIIGILMIPNQVTTAGFVKIVRDLGLTKGYLPYIPLILPAIAAPAVFFFMRQYMQANLSLEIVEAARVDGSGELATFNKIVLPIMVPAIAVQAIFSVVANWNNFFMPALIIRDREATTVPIVIAMARAQTVSALDQGQINMLTTLAVIPVLIIFLIFSRYIIGGISDGAVKG